MPTLTSRSNCVACSLCDPPGLCLFCTGNKRKEKVNMATRISRSEFEAFVTPLVEEIIQSTEQYKLPQNARQWFEAVSEKLYALLDSH
jgi:hypothetical protein